MKVRVIETSPQVDVANSDETFSASGLNILGRMSTNRRNKHIMNGRRSSKTMKDAGECVEAQFYGSFILSGFYSWRVCLYLFGTPLTG